MIIGYCRVSTEEQPISLDAQETRIRAYCQALDLGPIRVIRETASAKTAKREGLQAALGLIDRGEARAIVVTKIDRLTRSVIDLWSIVQGRFDHSGPAAPSLLSVGESIDTGTACGRMVLSMIATIAQWERETISERTRSALSHKKAKGEVVGRVPYGSDRLDGQLTVNRYERSIIERIIDRRRAGLTLRQVADHLNAGGWLTRSKRSWQVTQVRRILLREGLR